MSILYTRYEGRVWHALAVYTCTCLSVVYVFTVSTAVTDEKQTPSSLPGEVEVQATVEQSESSQGDEERQQLIDIEQKQQ